MSGLDLVAEIDGDRVILRPIDVTLPLARGAKRVAMATGALHDEQVFGAESKRPRGGRVKVTAGVGIVTETLEGQIERLTRQSAEVNGTGMEDGGSDGRRSGAGGGGGGRRRR